MEDVVQLHDSQLTGLDHTLGCVVDALRALPADLQVDLVLCLLEAAQRLLPVAVSGGQMTGADLAEIRSLVRATDISARSHLWSGMTPPDFPRCERCTSSYR